MISANNSEASRYKRYCLHEKKSRLNFYA